MPNVRLLSLLFVLAACVGCASSLCDSSMDTHYNAYGGVRDRIDRVQGRVGSRFDPAAALEPEPTANETSRQLPEALPIPSDAMDADDGKLSDELLDALEQTDDLPKVDIGVDDST